MPALLKLVAEVRAQKVQLLHAHGTSLLVAAMASLLPPHPKLIWHVHYGRDLYGSRPLALYRALARRAQGVIVVSSVLLDWARRRLRFPTRRTWLIPNFVVENGGDHRPVALTGSRGRRIACVANLRPQKNHLMLLRAMSLIARREPDARLFLLGAGGSPAYTNLVRGAITRLGLRGNVCMLGSRDDVAAVLRACDVAVLSSNSEALPLALLEYGLAGLPVVATDVGQCRDVLDDGRAGVLVPAGGAEPLAEAVLSLFRSPGGRAHFGERLRTRVRERYSATEAIHRLRQAYDVILAS